MAEVRLKATRRDGGGKGAARRARAGGGVPAIVYGRGMEPTSIVVDRRDFVSALHTEAGINVLLDLEIGGETTLALTREIQRDPVRGTLLHADFVKVDRTQEIEIEVPVQLLGEARGAHEGGVLEHQLFALHVRCRVTQVPEHIDADVSDLGIGDSLKVGDLEAGRDYVILNDPESVVVLVAAPVSAEEFEAMEAAVAAEVPEAAPEGAVAEGEPTAEAEAEGEESDES
jgi:large subunit ribosomal protein L25